MTNELRDLLAAIPLEEMTRKRELATADALTMLWAWGPQLLAVARGAKAEMEAKDAEIEQLRVDLRLASIPTRRHSDEAWARRCEVAEARAAALEEKMAATEAALREREAQIAESRKKFEEWALSEVSASEKEFERERNSLRSQLAAESNDAGLFHEVVKRLRGAFIVAGLGEWTEWQAAIDLLLKAVQAQAHFAGLASERHDRILELERKVIDAQADAERWEKAHDGILAHAAQMVEEAQRGAAEAGKDTALLDWLERWLTEVPTRWQIALRRMETTGQFIVGMESNGSRDKVNRFGTSLRLAINAASSTGSATQEDK
jgi:hypothetical protein